MIKNCSRCEMDENQILADKDIKSYHKYILYV